MYITSAGLERILCPLGELDRILRPAGPELVAVGGLAYPEGCVLDVLPADIREYIVTDENVDVLHARMCRRAEMIAFSAGLGSRGGMFVQYHSVNGR